MIEVVHIRHTTPDAIYIGRAMPAYNLAASPLGNPYRLTDESKRAEVLEQYRRWLWRSIKGATPDSLADTPQMRELHRLYLIWQETGALKLGCWCAPRLCHGDVIKSALEWLRGS